MIGDDIDSVASRMQEKHGIPIVVVHAPGFVGGKNLGKGGEAGKGVR